MGVGSYVHLARSQRTAEHIRTIPWPNSLGLFYATFTQYLGFTPYSDEWKVMGLAPYGVSGIDLNEFIVPNDTPYRVSQNCFSKKIRRFWPLWQRV